jgi:PAS domain S-box-containing protein
LRQAAAFDEAVMSNMGEGLYTVDGQGLVTFINPAAEELLGWKSEELLGRKMHDVTHHHHRDGRPFPAEECAGFQVLRHGKTLANHEDVFIRKDGTFFDVIYSSSPLRNEAGDITGLVVVFRDISERKQAEEARAKLAAIVESSEDAIISKDLNGVITSWNRGAEHLFGYTALEAIGQPVTMLIPPDHLDEEPDILARIRRGESVTHYETVRRRKDGTLFDISLTVSPLRNSGGQIIGASKVARDITHRKRNEEALRRAQAQLADRAGQLEQIVADRTAKLRETIGELEAFSYSISHDMRAPLRAIVAYARLVLDEHGGQLDETGKDYLSRLSKAASRLDRLVMDVLTYSRVERMTFPRETVDLERVVLDVIRDEPAFHPPAAEIEIQGPLPKVVGHEVSLIQCVNNLLSNAVKFVLPGTIPRIKIWSEAIDGDVRLWFEDNGIGIAMENTDRIFSLFGRLNPANQYAGTGIGLTIVRKAVQRMGGTAGVESEPGKGSRFWVQLKRSQA